MKIFALTAKNRTSLVLGTKYDCCKTGKTMIEDLITTVDELFEIY